MLYKVYPQTNCNGDITPELLDDILLDSVFKGNNIFFYVSDPGLYQGDMVLSPKQLKHVKEGTFFFGSLKDKSKLWPNGIVNDISEREFQIESDQVNGTKVKDVILLVQLDLTWLRKMK